MEEKNYNLHPRVRFLGKELKRMRDDLDCRNFELNWINDKNEHFDANLFWAKQEFLFYAKEYNHEDFCEHTERIEPPSSSNGYDDKLVKLDALCGDILDSLDSLYDSLSARILDIERLGPVLKYVANEQKDKILTCNHLNDLIFSRCNEKKYLEDSTSKVTRSQVIDLIQHVIAFGSTVFPDTPMSALKLGICLRDRNVLPMKNVSADAFYYVRNFINKKLTSNPVKIQKIANPFAFIGNLSYTIDEMKHIADILEKDRPAPVFEFLSSRVQRPLPAVFNLFDNSEETINNAEHDQMDVAT